MHSYGSYKKQEAFTIKQNTEYFSTIKKYIESWILKALDLNERWSSHSAQAEN